MGNSGSTRNDDDQYSLAPVTAYEPDNESAWNQDGSLNMLSTREKLQSRQRQRHERNRARHMHQKAQKSCAKGCSRLTRSALAASLVFLNLVFLVGAVVLLAVGSLAYIRLGDASQFADIPVGIGLMVVAGLVFLLSLLGCAGAYLEHRLLMKFYLFFLALLVLVQGGLVAAYFIKGGSTVTETAWSTSSEDVKAKIQDQLHCCGWLNVQDHPVSSDYCPNGMPPFQPSSRAVPMDDWSSASSASPASLSASSSSSASPASLSASSSSSSSDSADSASAASSADSASSASSTESSDSADSAMATASQASSLDDGSSSSSSSTSSGASSSGSGSDSGSANNGGCKDAVENLIQSNMLAVEITSLCVVLVQLVGFLLAVFATCMFGRKKDEIDLLDDPESHVSLLSESY